MFIQLKNRACVEGIINFLKYSDNFHLNDIIIERVFGIPEDIKGYNTLELSFTCSILTEVSTNYDEYKTVHLDYSFNIKKNRIICNSKTGKNVIKELIKTVCG